MSIVQFWKSIHQSGAVIVGDELDRLDPSDRSSLEQAIREVDSHWRLELPPEPPSLIVPVAVWAVMLMYRGSQFLVHRHIDAKTIQRVMDQPCPRAPDAPVCYSADLGFRILPELLGLARGLALDDPLVVALQSLASRWPLSSVGVADVQDVDVAPFIDHPCLRHLYAERIIQRQDVSRLSDAQAASAVRAALGAHGRELAPKIARALDDMNQLQGQSDGSIR